MLVHGHYYPEGNKYYEDGVLLYQNCEKIGPRTDVSDGHALSNMVLGIASAATIARILQGYEIERTGHYFNAFINDEGKRQAIVYPFPEMEWESFKNINEAYREADAFEEVKEELLQKGFNLNEQGFWVQKNKKSERKKGCDSFYVEQSK